MSISVQLTTPFVQKRFLECQNLVISLNNAVLRLTVDWDKECEVNGIEPATVSFIQQGC